MYTEYVSRLLHTQWVDILSDLWTLSRLIYLIHRPSKNHHSSIHYQYDDFLTSTYFFWQITELQTSQDFNLWCYFSKKVCITSISKRSRHRPSQPGTIHFLIGKFSYFGISFLYYIFFVINFSYLVIGFLLNSSVVKSNNEIGKVNDKKNLI